MRAGRHDIGTYLDLAAAFATDATPDVTERDRRPAGLRPRRGRRSRRSATAYAAWLRTTFRPALDAIGEDPKPGDSDDVLTRRGALWQLLGLTAGDTALQAKARTLAEAYLDQPGVAAAVVRRAGAPGGGSGRRRRALRSLRGRREGRDRHARAVLPGVQRAGQLPGRRHWPTAPWRSRCRPRCAPRTPRRCWRSCSTRARGTRRGRRSRRSGKRCSAPRRLPGHPVRRRRAGRILHRRDAPPRSAPSSRPTRCRPPPAACNRRSSASTAAWRSISANPPPSQPGSRRVRGADFRALGCATLTRSSAAPVAAALWTGGPDVARLPAPPPVGADRRRHRRLLGHALVADAAGAAASAEPARTTRGSARGHAAQRPTTGPATRRV